MPMGCCPEAAEAQTVPPSTDGIPALRDCIHERPSLRAEKYSESGRSGAPVSGPPRISAVLSQSSARDCSRCPSGSRHPEKDALLPELTEPPARCLDRKSVV